MTPAQRYAFGLRAWRENETWKRQRAMRDFWDYDKGRTPFRFGARSEATRARLARRGGTSRRA